MVATGNSAPDFKLPTSDRRSFVRLSSLRGKPVVLIFGSCTSPQFKTNADLIRSLHHEFKSVAQFLFVYIREVGAESRNVAGGEVKDAATIQERSDQAERTHRSLRIDMTCVVDDMDDPVTKTYSAWPERLCIIDKSGKIAVLSQPGPKGFHPTVKAVRNWLSSTR